MSSENPFSICPLNRDQWPVAKIGNFSWSAKHLEYFELDDDGDLQCFSDVTCEPTNVKKLTTLWSCLAKVTFLRIGGGLRNVLAETTFVHLFNSTDPIFHFSAKSYRGKPYYSRVRIEIVESYCVDFSDPKNLLIEGPEDAAHFEIGGVELYLSKKVLGFHSHFFYALFNSDFKEKAEDFYVLKDIKFMGILPFLAIIHSLDVTIDKTSYHSLIYLGDYFQCKLVLHLCEDFLLKDGVIPLLKKIRAASRFRLNRTLLAWIPEVTKEQWETIREKEWLSDFARNSFKEVMNFI